jgi:hypothetical protein
MKSAKSHNLLEELLIKLEISNEIERHEIPILPLIHKMHCKTKKRLWE